MTEFAAGVATLVLLLMGSLALGGYQEVDRRGVLAARQSAWLDSWQRGPGAAARGGPTLHEQFLADSGALEPTGRRLLVEADDLAVETTLVRPGGAASAAARLLLDPLEVVGGFRGSGFDLMDGGLVQGRVSLHLQPLRDLPAPFDALELDLHAPYVLLADAWHAGGAPQVQDRAGGLVPAARLAALNSIWQPLSVPLEIVEPALGQLCFGLIEPERIPEDRLGPGSTPLPRRCR